MPAQSKPTDKKLAEYDAIKGARYKVPNQTFSQWKLTGGKTAPQKQTSKRRTRTKRWVPK